MERESVGGTLRALHQALRPGGILLDILPEPEHARIQIRRGEETREVGHLDDSAYVADIHAGRAVMAALIREQFFVRDREVVFEQMVHATDVDTWLAYREERSTRSVLDPRIVQRMRAQLAEAGGELVVVERGYAGRCIKLPGRGEGEVDRASGQ